MSEQATTKTTDLIQNILPEVFDDDPSARWEAVLKLTAKARHDFHQALEENVAGHKEKKQKQKCREETAGKNARSRKQPCQKGAAH